MGFWEKAGKVAGFVADDMASTARKCSRDKKHFTEEQRETYKGLEERLNSFKEDSAGWSRYDK